MNRSVITLTTDFGDKDPFVGAMKGVILGINPGVALVDIAHGIEPQDVKAAAYVLKSACPYFPEGSIHVVVVDPGVGTARRPLLIAALGSFFLGPDNGVFSYIYRETEKARIFHVTATEYFCSPPQIGQGSRRRSEGTLGPTFHGRDLFAPVAAWLSKGVHPEKFGPEVCDPVILNLARPRPTHDGAIEGELIYIDRFGNLIMNITQADAESLGESFEKGRLLVNFSGRDISMRRAYAEGGWEEPGALWNSCGHLEIFVNGGSAREMLGAGVGARVLLRAL